MELYQSKGLKGTITVAPDKSISHRGVMIGAISKGKTTIENFLMGEDCLSTIDCFRKLGREIEVKGDKVTVYGKGMHGLSAPKELLYTGNSGTTTRLLCGLLAPQPFTSTIDGDATIRKRPMKRILNPLSLMGAKISSQEGFTPLHITGAKLSGVEYELPVASAQLKSALLFAGLYADKPSVLIEPEATRNHTELMVNQFGGKIITEGRKIIAHPAEELFAGHVMVPGDISSAAFFLVAGLILPNSELVLKGVGLNHTRTGIIDVLKAMGGNITIDVISEGPEAIGDICVKSSDLWGTEIGGDLIPRLIDELPVIAVAAAFAEGTTVIRDAAELKVKESNRIDAMERELKKAGVEVTATEDGMIIHGTDHITGAAFDTYHDHRIAMAMAILALGAEGKSIIHGHECISISYPGFFAQLKALERV